MLPWDLWTITVPLLEPAVYCNLSSLLPLSLDEIYYRSHLVHSSLAQQLHHHLSWKKIYQSDPEGILAISNTVAWDRHDHPWLIIEGLPWIDLRQQGVQLATLVDSYVGSVDNVRVAILLYLTTEHDLELLLINQDRHQKLPVRKQVRSVSLSPLTEGNLVVLDQDNQIYCLHYLLSIHTISYLIKEFLNGEYFPTGFLSTHPASELGSAPGEAKQIICRNQDDFFLLTTSKKLYRYQPLQQSWIKFEQGVNFIFRDNAELVMVKKKKSFVLKPHNRVAIPDLHPTLIAHGTAFYLEQGRLWDRGNRRRYLKSQRSRSSCHWVQYE